MKQTFMERAAHVLDFPADVLAGLPRIEIKGCREVYIENQKGLLSYDTDEIHINGGQVKIILKGEGFIIKAMNATELRIEGVVSGLEFIF